MPYLIYKNNYLENGTIVYLNIHARKICYFPILENKSDGRPLFESLQAVHSMTVTYTHLCTT